jgi:predicted nuclease of predicted toxin-antitoxin system
LGLDTTSDTEVWNFARDNDFVLVTKDADFSDMSLVRGFPPKVVWLRIGNCTTADIEALLRRHHAAIEQMGSNPSVGILSLS